MYADINNPTRLKKKKRIESKLERKARFLDRYEDNERAIGLLTWYTKHDRKHMEYLLECIKENKKRDKTRRRITGIINKLSTREIHFIPLSFVRWLIVDFLRGKRRGHTFGIYQFVALPGQGKTMSMVAHMERFIEECNKNNKPYRIATNFGYVHATDRIEHWSDMVKLAKHCYENKIACLIGFDEIHITFDSTDWKDFPPEVLAMLSFNRKYSLQFCCTSQIYERIPKKIRDIANYTVICKNILNADRWFRCYYFDKTDYESEFAGTKKKCQFIKEFIAGDDFYNLYNTLEQVDRMVEDAKKEKNRREEAFNILFGHEDDSEQKEERGATVERPRSSAARGARSASAGKKVAEQSNP